MRLLGSATKTDPASFYRNSDLAFRGRLAFAGNYLGFRIIDIADPEAPVVLADVDCPASSTTYPSGATCCSCRSTVPCPRRNVARHRHQWSTA
jgi:hypothetical protein